MTGAPARGLSRVPARSLRLPLDVRGDSSRARWNRTSAALAFAPMAGIVVDRTIPAVRSRLSAPPPRWFVLVAVAVGLLSGAMACVTGLAGGVAHSAPQPSVVRIDGLTTSHAGHPAPLAESASQLAPAGAGDRPAGTSMAGSHPGTACVVSVDLHFPEASSAVVSDPYEIPLLAMNTGCPADVDPPVPRFS